MALTSLSTFCRILFVPSGDSVYMAEMRKWRRRLILAVFVMVAAVPVFFATLVYTDFLWKRLEKEKGMTQSDVERTLFPAWSQPLDAEAILKGKKYNPPECDRIVTYWICGLHPIDVGYTGEKKVLYAFPTYE